LPALLFGKMRLDGVKQRPSGLDPAPVTPAQEASVTRVVVTVKGVEPLTLEFGSLAKPMEQMRACTKELVRRWGYDPDVQASLSRQAIPLNGAKWFTPADYPKSALRANVSGFVAFRLDVDAEGKVAGCHILDRTEPDEFAALTCRNIRGRARLQPALDAQGKPVRSFFVSKSVWQVWS
jgi:outer membrane biosynthesis protein TonB